jgi:hypothetical protein
MNMLYSNQHPEIIGDRRNAKTDKFLYSKESQMAKQRKPRGFSMQESERKKQLIARRRMAQNDLVPIARRITDDKVVDSLLFDVKSKQKKRKRK